MYRVAKFCIAVGLAASVTALPASSSHAGGNPPSQQTALPIDSSRKMADRDNAMAEERIGDLCWQGAADHPLNRTEAVRHYGNAANLGIASAERKLAIAYANGDGTRADDAQMLHWQRKAAEAGDAEAAGMLGYAIMIGLDGTYDIVEAATWLTLATENARSEAWRFNAASYARDAQNRLTQAEQDAFHVRLVHLRAALKEE